MSWWCGPQAKGTFAVCTSLLPQEFEMSKVFDGVEPHRCAGFLFGADIYFLRIVRCGAVLILVFDFHRVRCGSGRNRKVRFWSKS